MNRFSAKHDPWRLSVSVDVGGRIGFGHLRRCIAVASQARLMGAQVNFHVGGQAAAGCELVKASGFECEKDAVEKPAGMTMLVDRVHGDVLRQPDALLVDIARWRRQGARVAVIDGAGNDSLRNQRPGLVADLFIAPYVGENSDENESIRLLAGPAFAPLGAEYDNLIPRLIRATGDRILVSCGGSDPFKITAMVMTALVSVQGRRLTVRAVLGPGFEPAYCASLIEIGRNSGHTIEWIEAPESLASHICWSDLAVATSGLTKYELAAAGTPAVLISPDAMHDRANKPFSALGTSIDLGPAEHLTSPAVALALSALLDNPEQRSAMARAGQNAVDGHGAARIAKVLKELAYAET